jgi:hypothetical protein
MANFGTRVALWSGGTGFIHRTTLRGTMRSRPSILALLFAAVLVLPASADAQHCRRDCDDPDYDRDHEEWGPRRPTGGYLGGRLELARPQGEFGDYVESGFGGNVHYIHRLDRDGLIGIRVDGEAVTYGYERQRVLLSPTVGGRILADLVTTNNVAFLGVGPQVGTPNGTLRPYAHGFVGVSYLFTSSSLEGSHSGEPFASTTNFDDVTFAYGGGAGLYIPLRRGPAPVSLDLGATYRNAGRAEYLREGDIVDNPDGSISLFPTRSDTDMLSFHVGVTVGLSR